MPLVCNIPNVSPTDPLGLHADPVPVQDVTSEKPWHRLAIMMAGQGCTVTEIAERLDRSVGWVSLLLRQPWARERLTQEIALSGRDEISTLLKGAGPDAVRRIVYLSEEAENEAVKLAANRELLDRLLGKAVQKTELDVKGKMSLDMGVIDKEIKALEEQERFLLGGTTVAAQGAEAPVGESEVVEKDGGPAAVEGESKNVPEDSKAVREKGN